MSNEKTTMRYLYLRIYSNEELQAYLSKMLEAGWAITKTKGNFLFFRRHQLKNARLCVVSTECTDRSPKYDDQVNEYIDIALRLGWQLLCIGDYESVLPCAAACISIPVILMWHRWSLMRPSTSTMATVPERKHVSGSGVGCFCVLPHG